MSKRELVIQFMGGSEHTFPIGDQNEDELRAYFLESMSEEACKKGRVINWGGATFVSAWIVCFWFRDVDRQVNTKELLLRQTLAAEKVANQLDEGEGWKE